MVQQEEVDLGKMPDGLIAMEIKDYLSHIKHVRRYSHHTVIAYWADLVQFKSFCKKHLLEVVRADV
ncbi:MAG TPA: site-specific integrase, partial [Cyclobacteriaceae bacterium]|nr:site-specific integrase [Cyclobacteriaceae bacterium]